jgi:hypothetical protein
MARAVWAKLVHLAPASPRRSRATRKRLRVESLESRDLPSLLAYPTLLPVNSGGGATALNSRGPTGYNPAQIRHAYGFDKISFSNGAVAGDGSGTTIAIVDAYDDPNIANDLHQFDTAFGLPDPVFHRYDQNGGSNYPATNSGWITEIALDVEWAHAIAPKATIDLFEANSATEPDMFTAVQTAAKSKGVDVVSMSWMIGEFPGEDSYDSDFVTPSGHNGVTFVASSGDSGAPPSYPAISVNVVAVGGTTLPGLDAAGDYTSETGWSGSGGGLSAGTTAQGYESQPSYQKGVVTQSSTQRANPDVSFDADPKTGFSVYDSYTYGTAKPWVQWGGTSDAAPQWAALIAIADQGRALAGLGSLNGATQTLPDLYALPAGDFHPITSGTSTGTPNYSAGSGYNLVTGRGTPIANLVVSGLVSSNAATHVSVSARSSVKPGPSDDGLFVSGTYHDVLGSAVDAQGLANNVAPIDAARFALLPSFADGFLFSEEYFSDLVSSWYQKYLGRAVDPGGLAGNVASLLAGFTDEQVIAGLVGSGEYFTKNGGTDLSFLQAAYLNILGRKLDSAGQAAFLGQLDAGVSRTTVAMDLLNSGEYRANLVAGYYSTFLNRTGSAKEITAWVGKLADGIRDETVISYFVCSQEYFQNPALGGDTNQLWLTRLYQKVLNRAPDAAGLSSNLNGLLNAYAAQRQTESAGLLSSDEYRTDLVKGWYQKYLGRAADAAGRAASAAALAAGATDEQVIAALVGSDEYFARHRSTNLGFLQAAYSDILGRRLDSSGQAFYLNLLASGVSRTAVASQLLTSTEYRTNLVSGFYTKLFGRSGSSTEVAGYVAVIAAGETDEQVINAFLTTGEYFLRTHRYP